MCARVRVRARVYIGVHFSKTVVRLLRSYLLTFFQVVVVVVGVNALYIAHIQRNRYENFSQPWF